MLKTSIDTRTRTDAESIESDPLLQLYRWMLLSRQLDMAKADLVNRGEAFFHISGCGHEGMATLASPSHAQRLAPSALSRSGARAGDRCSAGSLFE